MKFKWTFVALAAFLTAGMLLSCEEGEGNERLVSSFNDDESHNSGQNCMNCHTSGGGGEGWFEVAGTVYDAQLSAIVPNATILLSDAPNGTGTTKYTLEGDSKGNFYTTEKVDFGTGLYVSVAGTGAAKYMNSKITSGACNSCHGFAEERIWTN